MLNDPHDENWLRVAIRGERPVSDIAAENWLAIAIADAGVTIQPRELLDGSPDDWAEVVP